LTEKPEAGLKTGSPIGLPAPPREPERNQWCLLFVPRSRLFTAGLFPARFFRTLFPLIGAFLSVALWLAAILIFLAERSNLAAIATLVFATILLWPSGQPRPGNEISAEFAQGIFTLPNALRLMRQLPWALGVALLAHSAAVLGIGNHWFAAVEIGIAGAVLYWRGLPWVRHESGLAVLRIVSAMLLIAVGLLAYLVRGAGGSKGATGHAAEQNPPPADAAAGTAAGGAFTGVILIPEVQKHVTLVPPLPELPSDVFKKPDDNPLSIPFYGVYWFFRPPDGRPPANSVTVRGTPEDFRFRSIGRAPLKMEAHQNLGKLFNLSCCSRIQVAIHNVENAGENSTEPGRVELILADSSDPLERGGVPPESLGMQAVDGSEHQLLSFALRSNSGLQQFDELTVRIFRGRLIAGSDRSARISVERFVLVPRGR
jgi:hypothetical protein